MRKSLFIISVLIFFISKSITASDWSDLDRDDRTLYGSEKEENYTYDLGIAYMENWKDGSRYSHMVLWLYKNKDYPKYQSLRIFPFWYHIKSKNDSRIKRTMPALGFYDRIEFDERFTISPLYYYERDSEGYDMSLLYLYWWGIRDTTIPAGDRYYTLLPVFYYMNNSSGDIYRHRKFMIPALLFYTNYRKYYIHNEEYENGVVLDRTNASIFHYYSSRKNPAYKETTWWIPLLPLYFYSKNQQQTHRNFLWLADWETSKKGTDRFWLIPFVFYESKPDGYRYYFPFYMKPRGWNQEEGVTYSILHYYQWAPNETTRWILPWFSWDYHPEQVDHQEYFQMMFPLYASWEFYDSKGDILLPWSIDYRDAHNSFYVNILGIYKSASLKPVVFSNAGTSKDGTWFFDTDAAWLYDVFSIETRISLKNPIRKNDEGPVLYDVQKKTDYDAMLEKGLEEKLKKKNAPGIPKKEMRISRKNSEYFWGTRILFGLFSYEMADSKRHFRLLPFTWLSWDKNSSDNLYVVPPVYFKYKSEAKANDFLIVFPFYGSMNTPAYYGRSYLTILYWDEYYKEANRWEKNILWPFVNIYKSPRRFGYRVIPFVWHKSLYEGSEVSSRYITPLFFSYSKDNQIEKLSRDLMINLAYFYSEKKYGAYFDRLTLVPIIPLFIQRNIEERFHRKIDSEEKTYTAYRREKNTLWFPAIYTAQSSHHEWTSDTKTYSMFSPLLFYFQSRSFEERKTDNSETKKDYEYQIFLFGYYHADMEVTTDRFLYNFFHYSRSQKLHEKEVDLLFGLYGYKKEAVLKVHYLLPFYYYRKKQNSKYDPANYQSRIFINIFYYSEEFQRGKISINQYDSDKGLKQRTLWFPIIPLVVKHDSKGDVYKKIRFYSGVYFYESDYYKIQNYFLIYNYSRDLIDSSREHGLFLSSLSYKKTDTRRKYSMLYDYLMNYRYETDEMDYKFRAAFSLLRIKHNDSIYRNSFFPLWYYSHYSNYKTLWFTPFLTYMDREFKDKYDLVLLGLLYYRDYIPDEEYDRRLWLSGILWDEIRKPEKGYHSMASVWGLLWEHETESVNDFKKLTILKGIYKYVNNKGRIKRRILWVIPI